ncbi:flavodoxin family protein [Halomonas tibetensis]|uniref:Flavodoxin family protein n=1 Tax=Halomonas tibetensis TaxID=2259590 RepID=A0ABV7B7L6_9GAMM
MPKRLLIVIHAPSPNTQVLSKAAERGACHPEIEGVALTIKSPLETVPEDVLACDAILIGTTENLGYMAGLTKDFFDRSYYPVLEEKQGLPCALYVRAGHDGTGTRRAVESIVSGLRWKWAQEPLILRGEWQEGFVEQVEELAMTMAAGLEAGVL